MLGPVNVTDSRDGYLSTSVRNLGYAFEQYDLNIKTRVQPKAFRYVHFKTKDDHMSKITNLTFKTFGRIPDQPPKIDAGSFCVFNNGSVHLYAESVPKQRRNGDRFEYIFNVVGAPTLRIDHVVQGNVVMYTDVADTDVTFAVRSKNVHGISLENNRITVPRSRNRCPRAIKLKLIKSPDGVHYLRWQPPPKESLTEYCPQITNYTIFRRFDDDMHRENAIAFERVNNATFQFSVTSLHVLAVGVSANSINSSSGIVWVEPEECSFSNIENSKLTAIDKAKSTGRSIELSWTLNCLEEQLVTAYNVKYCPVNDSLSQSCTSEPIQMNLKHEPTFGCNVTHLTPFTWYLIQIQFITSRLSGPFSEPYVVRTLEEAPSSPRSVNFSDVTNTTVRLSWCRPAQPNGRLTIYMLKYNDKILEIRANYSESFEYILRGLNSSERYSVQVKACTSVGCSENSDVFEFVTEIGSPGEISHLSKVENDDAKMVTWTPPDRPGGPIDYYELRQVITVDEGQPPITRIITIQGTNCTLVSSDCQSGAFSVRAINVVHSPFVRAESTGHRQSNSTIDADRICIEQNDYLSQSHENSTALPGTWSNPLQILCEGRYSFIYYIPIALMFFAALITYSMVYARRKLEKMRDIRVELPIGLSRKSMSFALPFDTESNSIEDANDCLQVSELQSTDTKAISEYVKNVCQPSIVDEVEKVGRSKSCLDDVD